MLKLNWNFRHSIQTIEDINRLVNDANKCRPNISGFDTETTGLHIIFDKPFLFQFGFANLETKEAYVYYVDIEIHPEIAKQAIEMCWKIAERTFYLTAHNTKFDLHMMQNIGMPYPYSNLTDTMIMIRLGTDALPTKRGGAPLQLKPFVSQFIDRDARMHESELLAERTKIAADYNKDLKNIVKSYKVRWDEAESFFKDAINLIEDFGPGFKEKYDEWYNKLPEKIRFNMKQHFVTSDDIPYNMLNRELVYMYGMYDIVYVLEVVALLRPILHTRKQIQIFNQENELILPLFDMEREGFYMNKPYIYESEKLMREYIIKQRMAYQELAGMPIKSSQSQKNLQVLQNRFKIDIASTGKEVLEELMAEPSFVNDPKNEKAIEFIKLLQELRTLEKWFTTYLMRFVKEAGRADYAYTSINQATPVTGRFSSDFQQFPKNAIYNDDELTDTESDEFLTKELFNPRMMVQKPPEADGLAYLDYSQIELRFQLLYILLLNVRDLNLARAYMPFECYRWDGVKKVPYRYDTPERLAEWDKYEWFQQENDLPWHPTDLHKATALEAFPEAADGVTEVQGMNLAKLRGAVGKGTNFAKNYGAQLKRIQIMFRKFNFTQEKLIQIDEAYYKAFPGIKEYQKYCYEIAAQGYMTNLMGRRYYNITGHNGINALIQGSSADFLKLKIIELWKYIKEKGLKSRMFMNIHDEIQFIIYNGEWKEIWNFQRIMQDFKQSLVPIVADIEVTKTLWADKVEVNSVQDINEIAN